MAITVEDCDRIVAAFADNHKFSCPHCGHSVSVNDCEVAQHVVSYWGDDLHDFSCNECGEDFLVKETVTRRFETAKNYEDFK